MRLELPRTRLRFDQAPGLRVTDCAPLTAVTLRLRMVDPQGTTWSSWGRYAAEEDGTVDPLVQPPLEGSYFGRDAFGLLSSMAPPEGERKLFWPRRDTPLTLEVSAESPEYETQSGRVERWLLAPTVTREEVPQGVFYLPPGVNPPALLLLGASGCPEDGAALLASHGYAVLAAGLPPFPVAVEWVEGQLDWLRRELGRTRIGLCGTYRAAELALLAATRMGGIDALVSCSGSGLIFADSWTWKGEPVPGLPLDLELARGRPPQKLRKAYEEAVARRTMRDLGRLPAEKIEAPLLLVSGQEDGVWPAAAFSELICQRLKRTGQEFPVVHRTFHDTGHMLGPELGYPHRPCGSLMTTALPYPGPEGLYDLGGRAARQAHSQREAYALVLQFLAEYLGGDRSLS